MPLARPDRDAVPDETLMLAYAQGDAGAFDTLYARHRGGLYRYCLRHLGHAGGADEVFQDIWMNVVRVRETYAPTAKFATWLYTLAHNRIVDRWRAGGRATLLSLDGDDDDDGGGTVRREAEAVAAVRADGPEARAVAGEIATRIAAALAALPPEQRDAFLLQYEGGHSLAEIAEITGAGHETVKSRLRYATAKLRGLLMDLRDDAREDSP